MYAPAVSLFFGGYLITRIKRKLFETVKKSLRNTEKVPKIMEKR